MSESIVENLWQIICDFAKSYPKAIWFVDREGLYRYVLDNLMAQYPCRAHLIDMKSTGYHTIFGLPLLRWNSHIATPEENSKSPSFCSCPGVWVEMSDGKHFQLTFPERHEIGGAMTRIPVDEAPAGAAMDAAVAEVPTVTPTVEWRWKKE